MRAHAWVCRQVCAGAECTDEYMLAGLTASSPPPPPLFSSFWQIAFLRHTSARLDDKHPSKKQLEFLLSSLPQEMPPSPADYLGTPGFTSSVSPDSAATAAANLATSPDTPGSQRKLFKGKCESGWSLSAGIHVAEKHLRFVPVGSCSLKRRQETEK